MTIDWKPITAMALKGRIRQGARRMNPKRQRLWRAIQIEPEKWQQHPYGDQGGGFWVVGIIGCAVVWYNDIEDGFNRSTFRGYGVIEEYWCNQDELDVAVEYLANALELGHDLVRMGSKLRTRRR